MFYKNFLIDDGAAVPRLSRKCGSRALIQHRDRGRGHWGDPPAAREDMGHQGPAEKRKHRIGIPQPHGGATAGATLPTPPSLLFPSSCAMGLFLKLLVQLPH